MNDGSHVTLTLNACSATQLDVLHQASLRILRDCRRAIFEMSYRGAQNVEYDRLLDYELVQPLVVVEQGAEQLNSFEREIATRMGAKVGMYSDQSELLRLVDAWLGSDGAAPAWPVYERVRSEPSY